MGRSGLRVGELGGKGGKGNERDRKKKGKFRCIVDLDVPR